jgi:hypothetical protein
MFRLDDELTRAGWPHDHRAREGAHALTDGDIDVALSFLARVPREGLPLRPPLGGHEPRSHDSVAEAPEAAMPEALDAGEPSDSAGIGPPESLDARAAPNEPPDAPELDAPAQEVPPATLDATPVATTDGATDRVDAGEAVADAPPAASP